MVRGAEDGQERPVINWDRPMLERLKKAYSATPNDPNHVFIFEGNKYLRSYAKYLIEFLESKLWPKPG
jgi:hypothetical protein